MDVQKLALFEEKEIRKVWKDEKWYFSVVDVIFILTDSVKARDYWYRLKQRVSDEDKIELSTICRQLKLLSSDGKRYLTDCADTEGILRIIQSIPSPKAEPFKRWLAQVGAERIEEINDPELAITRAKQTYELKGYPKSWIEQRILGIKNRNKLTDEWKIRGAKNKDYGILTNQIYKYGFGYTANEMRKNEGLSPNVNVRDHFSEIGLALTNLGEVTARELHITNDSEGLEELKNDTQMAGMVIKNARIEIEGKLKREKIEKI